MHANNFFSNQLDCCCCGSSMSFVPCFQALFFLQCRLSCLVAVCRCTCLSSSLLENVSSTFAATKKKPIPWRKLV